jgi:hypothetical protein
MYLLISKVIFGFDTEKRRRELREERREGGRRVSCTILTVWIGHPTPVL